MNRLLFSSLLFVFCGTASHAQVLEGVVLDKNSGEPVEFANVYFANTTTGTYTDENGAFRLDDFSAGKYDLTVSFVGYETYYLPLEIPNGKNLQLTIRLNADAMGLPEVFVSADTTGWLNHFRDFKTLFLGRTPASQNCTIENPETLLFYFSPEKRTLFAHAREPIRIRNHWLGYDIFYDLRSFQYNFGEGRLNYTGIPRFETPEPKSKTEAKRWKKRRRKEYLGSLLHFVRSLYAGKLNQDKFMLQEVYSIPNPDRLPDELLQERLAYYREQARATGTIRLTSGDSLSYYAAENRKPAYIDSLGPLYTSGDELVQDGVVPYVGKFKLIYKGALESPDYPNKGWNTRNFQQSSLWLENPLRIYSNGYYEEVPSLYVEGYLSWSGNIASLLPMDYYPED